MTELTQEMLEVPPSVDRARKRAGVVGLIFMAIALAGAFANPAQFFQSYLVAFIFWTMVALGCLALMMLHHLSGGGWGLVIRRLLEAAARTLPVMAILYLPILVFGLQYVYEWARPDVVAADPILRHKAPYMNPWFFTVRWALYFAIWSTMALLLVKWSSEQDRQASADQIRRFSRLSGPGLVIFGLTMTLATVDWVMSTDPHYYSTMWGFLYVADSGLTALAFIITCMFLLRETRPFAEVFRGKYLHDLGKLLFAFVMLHAYLAFSQFLITWMANLPEEIPWYLKRFSGGWQYVAVALVLAHFVLPFALLLSADVKQNARMLTAIAVGLLVMRVIDIFWTITPQFHEGTFHVHWLDLAALIGLGGIWLAAFLWYLRGRPLLPVNDPYFRDVVLHHGSH
jgi:hypothetical protein